MDPISDLMDYSDEDEIFEGEMMEEEAFDPLENLASDMGDEELEKIAESAAHGYEVDEASMADWKKRSDDAMELATMVSQGGSWPFEGCSNIVLPLVAQSVIQFAARAYPAIINDNRPVKARTLGVRAAAMGSAAPQAMMGGMGGEMPPMPPQGPDMLPPEMMGMMPPETPPSAAPAPGMMPGGMTPPPAELPLGAPGPMDGIDAGGFAPPGQPSMGGGMQSDGGNVDENEKQNQADRQADFMSWQLLEQMEEWESELDTLLHILPSIGSAWKKVWFDPSCNRNISELVHPSKVVINNKVGSVERLPRISVDFELYPWEIEERMRDGRWRRIVLDKGADDDEREDETDSAPMTFVEQLCRIDLDKDGYEEPVIVVYHKASRQVVRISRDYQPEDVYKGPDGQIYKIKRFSEYILFTFIPDPSGGVLGLGFGHILQSIAKASNGITNLLIDSGILANAGGGFIRKSARIPAKAVNGGLNKWFVTDIPDGVDPFVPFPRPAPDATLFNMLGMLQNVAKEITSTTDLMMGDLSKNVAPTTALAMIEQGTKVYTAIYKRIYRSLKKEYKALARLNYLFLDPQTLFEWNDSTGMVSPEDFDPEALDVVPAADPNMVSDMTEMSRVGALQMFIGDPMIDQVKLRKRMLSAMKVGEDMMAPPPPPPPPDPQMQIETAKLELEQQRLQLEQMKMQLEMQLRQMELQIKAQDSEVKAMVAMQKGGEQPSVEVPDQPSPLDLAKAAQAETQAHIDAMMAPLEADKIRAETELTLAKAQSEGVKARSTAMGDQMAQTKMAIDAQRGDRQERRADQQAENDARFKEQDLKNKANVSKKKDEASSRSNDR